MRRITFLIGPLVIMMLTAESAFANGQAGLEANSAGLENPSALVMVLDPQPDRIYGAQGSLHVRVRLSALVTEDSFEARVNGNPVTDHFQKNGSCSGGRTCEEEAWISPDELQKGENILLFDVQGPNESTGVARTKFVYQTGSLSDSASVEKLVPGVAINSAYLPRGADPNNTNNFQIVIGPGPGFTQRVYTAEKLSCSAGSNSVQVLVLNRRTLEPESTVGNSSQPGQACFGDAGSLDTFLKAVPKGDLVIANSFFGLMPNLNTTAIGGRNYSALTPQTSPRYYSIIGVAGAAAGQANESFQPATQGVDYITPLVGSLMLDNNQNYSFVSSEYLRFQVIPNDPVFPGRLTTTFVYHYEPFRYHLPEDAKGGFVLFGISRQKSYALYQQVYATNSSDPAQSANAANALAGTLNNAPRELLLMLTTIGVPFSSRDRIPRSLFDAINGRGGNGYLLSDLVPPSGDERVPQYTLISSTDPSYLLVRGQVLENSSLRADQGETGYVDGLLARNRLNQWTVSNGLTDRGPGQTASPSPAGYEWTQVGFQQSRDWPDWTASQRKAYEDLTSVNNIYPLVGASLGCNSSQDDPCRPIRSYYDGGIGGTGTAPSVAHIPYANLVYQPGRGYTAEDFKAVIQQLQTEQGYLRNVYTIYSQFMQLALESSNNLPSQLTAAAQNIEESLRKNNGNKELLSQVLAHGNNLSRLIGLIPGAGPAFGSASVALSTLSIFTASANGIPSNYSVTLNQLLEKNKSFGINFTNSLVTFFTGITNDWGKLSTIGQGYGAGWHPWHMCPTCRNANVPRSALPMLAYEAKRDLYVQLLPTLYSMDEIYDSVKSDPRDVGGWYYDSLVGFSSCISAYRHSTSQDWGGYPNVGGPQGRNDMYIATRTTSYDPVTRVYLPDSLLDNFFALPDFNGSSLGGGVGYPRDKFFSRSGPLNNRGALIPGQRRGSCGS